MRSGVPKSSTPLLTCDYNGYRCEALKSVLPLEPFPLGSGLKVSRPFYLRFHGTSCLPATDLPKILPRGIPADSGRGSGMSPGDIRMRLPHSDPLGAHLLQDALLELRPDAEELVVCGRGTLVAAPEGCQLHHAHVVGRHLGKLLVRVAARTPTVSGDVHETLNRPWPARGPWSAPQQTPWGRPRDGRATRTCTGR